MITCSTCTNKRSAKSSSLNCNLKYTQFNFIEFVYIVSQILKTCSKLRIKIVFFLEYQTYKIKHILWNKAFRKFAHFCRLEFPNVAQNMHLSVFTLFFININVITMWLNLVVSVETADDSIRTHIKLLKPKRADVQCPTKCVKRRLRQTRKTLA